MKSQRPVSSTLHLPPLNKVPSSPRMRPQGPSDIKLLEKLSNSRFPIFMALSRQTSRYLAVKIFPYQESQPSKAFLNESRFIMLKHPNVIEFYGIEPGHEATYKGQKVQVSYIMMELAVCDFAELILAEAFNADEILQRTYFCQLIEGLEYLHSQNVIHYDIKPENLLLGEDLRLKITDFDFSSKNGEILAYGRGTQNYRAPELVRKIYKYGAKSDIYAAGITLFVMKIGYMPYDENGPVNGYDLQNLLYTEPENFWFAHEQIRGAPLPICEDFKELFISMTRKDPMKRASIEDIKNNAWFNGYIYNKKETSSVIKKILNRK